MTAKIVIVKKVSPAKRSEHLSTGVVPLPTRAGGTGKAWGVAANGYSIRRGAGAGLRQACWEWSLFLHALC